jgi:hypothetical protein
MPDEPVRGEPRDPSERSGLLEEMRRSRHEYELALAVDETVARLLVQLDDAGIVAAHDEQRRRLEPRECGVTREVGAAATRDHRADALGQRGRDAQRGGRAGARAEEPDGQRAHRLVVCKKAHRIGEPRAEQRDVEAPFDVAVFFQRKEVQSQRAEAGLA